MFQLLHRRFLVLFFCLITAAEAQSFWVARNSGITNNLYAIQGSSNQMIAVGASGRFVRSANGGLSWSNGQMATGGTNLTSLAYGGGTNNMYVAGGVRGAVFYSTTGSTWTRQLIYPQTTNNIIPSGYYTNEFLGLTYANVLFQGGAINFFGVGHSAIESASAGTNWGILRTPAANQDLYSLAINSKRIVAVGDGGRILVGNYSSWTSITNVVSGGSSVPIPSNDLRSVSLLNSNYVAVGKGGALYVSSNGTNWNVPTTVPGTTPDLNGAAYGDGYYVAVGNNGTIWKSKDATNWVDVSTNTVNYNAIGYTNGTFIIVGDHGTVLTSGKPTIAIVSPSSLQKFTNATLIFTGHAYDSNRVTNVLVRLGTNSFFPASTTNSWTNWTANITNLVPGTNVITAKAVNADGRESFSTNRSVFYVLFTNLTAVVVPETLTNSGHVLTGNGTILGSYTNSPNLEISKNYTITATPAAGSFFSRWVDITGTTTNGIITQPTYTFTMEAGKKLEAHFVPNMFPYVAGTYYGVGVPSSSDQALAGYWKLTLSKTGAFSAQIIFNGVTYNLSSSFNGNGDYTYGIIEPQTLGAPGQLVSVIPGTSGYSAIFTLHVDLTSNSNQITGQFQNAGYAVYGLGSYAVYGWVILNRDIFSTNNLATNFQGKYTVLIPPDTTQSQPSMGQGYGTINIDSLGAMTFAGVLGDGTIVSQSTKISSGGEWPLYVKTFNGAGSISGLLLITNAVDQADIEGQLNWIRPSGTTAYYKSGFKAQPYLIGSRYVTPTNAPVLPAVAANAVGSHIVLFDGNLAKPINHWVSIGSTNGVSVASPSSDQMTAGIDPASGLFSGSFLNPFGTNRIPFSGAVLQKFNYGAGQFAGTNQYGTAYFGRDELAKISTRLGSIYVALNTNDCVVGATNFLYLASTNYASGTNFYDKTLFHRVVQDFVIQGGDPLTKSTNNMFLWGSGGPGYTLPLSTNLTHYNGAMAYASSGAGQPSNGSQFYICDGPQSALDGGYMVFGSTLAGLTTVHAIASAPTTNYPVANLPTNSIPMTVRTITP